MHQKLVPDSSLILANNHSIQEIFLKIRYFEIERGSSKIFLKVNFIFSFNPFPFNGQNYQKQKGPGTSEQLL